MKKLILTGLFILILCSFVSASFIGVEVGAPFNYSSGAISWNTGLNINSTDISMIYTLTSSGFPYVQTLKYNSTSEIISKPGSAYNYLPSNTQYISMAQVNDSLFISTNYLVSATDGHADPLGYTPSTYTYIHPTAGVTYESSNGRNNNLIKINDTHYLNIHRGVAGSGGRHAYGVILQVSGTTITVPGALYKFSTTAEGTSMGLAKVDDTHFLVTYENSRPTAVVLELNPTTNNLTSYATLNINFDSGSDDFNLVQYNSTHYLNVYRGLNGDGYAGILKVNPTWTVSEVTPEFEWDTSDASDVSAVYLGSNYFGISYTSLTEGKFTVLYYNTTSQTLTEVIDKIIFAATPESSLYNKLIKMDSGNLINLYKGADTYGYAIPFTLGVFDSSLTVDVTNLITQEPLTDLNITVTNGTYTETKYINGTYNTTFYLNAGTYNVSVIKNNNDLGLYITTTVEHILTADVDDSLTINMSVYSMFNLYDEKTLEIFNISSPNEITLATYCSDTTRLTTITNETTLILFDCDFEKFKIILDFGDAVYYRTFLYDITELENLSIYLIDLTTTQALYNSFSIDDIIGIYDNPSIYIKKRIDDKIEIITADYTDIENKIGAYLIENNEYIVEVHSDNQPLLILGTYSADSTGEKVLTLNEVTIVPGNNLNFENNVYWYAGIYNISNTTYVRGRYIDLGNLTTSVTFYVWLDEFNGTILYVSPIVDSYDIEWLWNASAHNESTLVAGFYISHPELSNHWVGRVVQVYQTISLGIEQYLNSYTLNWFFTLLLGTIALMATIRTANYVSMLLVGMGGLFVMFGWFSLTWVVLALAGLFSLLTILRSGAESQ